MTHAQPISGNENLAAIQAMVDGADSYTLDAAALSRFITRFLAGELEALELETIGDAIEGAEMIEFIGPGADGLIAQVLFEISPPGTSGAITTEAAERWLRLLGSS